jgi:hypothetical protein
MKIVPVRLKAADGKLFYVECYSTETVDDLCKLLATKYGEMLSGQILLRKGPTDLAASDTIADAIDGFGDFVQIRALARVEKFSDKIPERIQPRPTVGSVLTSSGTESTKSSHPGPKGIGPF